MVNKLYNVRLTLTRRGLDTKSLYVTPFLTASEDTMGLNDRVIKSLKDYVVHYFPRESN